MDSSSRQEVHDVHKQSDKWVTESLLKGVHAIRFYVTSLFITSLVLFVSLAPKTALAILYAPGATLDPACLPTDAVCGVETPLYEDSESAVSITSTSTAPATTTNKLYNLGGVLYWSGSLIGGASGLASLNGLASSTQTFATSTNSSALSFDVTSTGSTHTFAISLASGYSVPLTASTTAWNTFYDTPSTQIAAGSGLYWSGNTLVASSTNFATTTINGVDGPTFTFVSGAGLSIATSSGTVTFTPSYANATTDGIISTTTQTIAGDKTFTGTSALATTTVTNLTVSGDTSLQNATSTNFFASILSGLTGWFTDFFADNATTTNLVAGNLTATSSVSLATTIITAIGAGTTTDAVVVRDSSTGELKTIAVADLNTLTSIATTGSTFIYTDEAGATTSIDIKNLETLTSVLDTVSASGTLRYIAENGATTTVAFTTLPEITITGTTTLAGIFRDMNSTIGTAGQILVASSTGGLYFTDSFAPSAGTATSSTLRWNGVAWVENTGFTSDGTTATTTNFAATGDTTLANATATNLFATNLTATDANFTSATSTSFFATLFRGITGFFTDLFATNATTTNLVAGNLTATSSVSLATTTITDIGTGSTTTDYVLTRDNATGEVRQLAITDLETLTSISTSTSTFTYTDEDGATTTVDIKDLETLTSILDNVAASGTLAYIDEDGATTTISFTTLPNLTVAGTATTTNLVATGDTTLANATATNLYATNLSAQDADLTNATSTNLFATLFRGITGYFTDLFSNTITVGDLTATSTADVKTLTASTTVISGTLAVTGTSTLATTSATTLSANTLTVSGHTILATASSTDQTLSGYLVVGGQTTLQNASTTNLSASGNLNVSGTTTLASVLNLSALTGGLLQTNASGTVSTTSLAALLSQTLSWSGNTLTSVINGVSTTTQISYADATTDGLLSTTTQTIAGSKTFVGTSTLATTTVLDLTVTGHSVFTTASSTDQTLSGYLVVQGTTDLATTTATGLTISQNGLTLASSTPLTTSDTLYNLASALYWNGFALSTTSVAVGTATSSTLRFDGSAWVENLAFMTDSASSTFNGMLAVTGTTTLATTTITDLAVSGGGTIGGSFAATGTSTLATTTITGLTVSGDTTLATTTVLGLAISQNGLSLSSSTPAATTNTLYNLGSTLYWNGGIVGGEFTSTALAGVYDVSTASYDSTAFSLSGPVTFPYSMMFNDDGTKMYVLDMSGRDISEYSLTTAYDPSTASYIGVALSVSGQLTQPTDMKFNNDGTKLYVIGNISDAIYAYTLSTPYDVSTGVSAGLALSVSAQETNPTHMLFNGDGTVLYMMGTAGDDINAYNLSTPYDVSTGVFSSVVLSVGAQDINPASIEFNNDGTVLYMLGLAGQDVNAYNLTTAYDISTASFSSIVLSVSAQVTFPTDLEFNNDGTAFYVTDRTNDDITKYTIPYTPASTYLTDTTAYFGIGTTSPASMLTVAGDSSFTDTATFNGGINIASSTPASTAQMLYALGSGLYWNGSKISTPVADGTATSSTLRWDGSGWVENTGFTSDGTTATTTNFVVTGDTMLANATSTNFFSSVFDGITGWFTNLFATNATTTNLVAGSFTATSSVSLASTTLTAVGTGTSTDLLLTRDSSTGEVRAVSISDMQTVTSMIDAIAASSTLSFVNENGATTTISFAVLPELDVAGTATTTDLYVYGNGTIATTTAGVLTVLGHSTFATASSTDQSLSGYLVVDGNTTLASTTITDLVVSGHSDLQTASSTALTVSGHTVLASASSTDQSLSGYLNVTGDLTVDTNTLYVDSANNRVGIGMTNPSQSLEVDNGNMLVQGANSYAAGGDRAYLYMGDTNAYISAENGFGLKFGVSGAADSLVLAETTGNVGIGTTTPANKLSVNGGINIASTTPASTADALYNLGGALYWNGSQVGTSDWTSGNGSTTLNTISDLVGIGTDAPSNKLEVLSTTAAQLGLKYDTSNYHTLQVASDGGLNWAALGTDADLNFDFSGATDGDFSVNTNDLFVDTSTSNVGVGTTTPGDTLTVAGTANFTGQVTANKSFQAGSVTESAGSWTVVTFATAFDTAPIVTAVAGDGQNSAYFVRVRNITTTQFEYIKYNHDGTTHSGTDRVNWVAIVATQ